MPDADLTDGASEPENVCKGTKEEQPERQLVYTDS